MTTRKIVLLVFPGVQSLDVSGPLDVFSEANRFLSPGDRYELEVLGTEHGLLSCSNGLSIQAHRHFSEMQESCDLLLVTGGPELSHQDLGDKVSGWLRTAVGKARRYGSICNGAFILARAGLLEGRVVTTHWNDALALQTLSKNTRVEADRLFVQDGSLYTSAGVTAGIDLCLHLLFQDHGSELALNVAKRLVVFMQRAGGQSQFSPFLTPYVELDSPVGQVHQYVLEHLADDLNISALSDIAKMSPRNFSRVFVRETKITPAAFVEGARVDAARVLLENSTLPLKSVAYDCGFGSAHSMREIFKKRFGISPQQYRHNFGRPDDVSDGCLR